MVWKIGSQSDNDNEELNEESDNQEDDTEVYSSWKKRRTIPKSIINAAKMVGVGLVVFIFLFIVFKPIHKEPVDEQLTKGIETRLKNMEDRLASFNEFEKKLVLVEKMSKGYEDIGKRIDGLDTLLTMRVENLEKKLSIREPRRDNDVVPPKKVSEKVQKEIIVNKQEKKLEPEAVKESHTKKVADVKKRIPKADIVKEDDTVTKADTGKKANTVKKAESGKKTDTVKKAKIHEVEAGETLYHISKTNGLTIEELLKMNDLPADSTIHPGQKLKVKP